MNFYQKFQKGLKKTSDYFSSNLIQILSQKKINQEIVEEIESILISSDIGLEVTNQLIKKIQDSKISNLQDSSEIFKILSDEFELILKPKEQFLLLNNVEKPTVLIFIGVNGSGKTTTIGKILNKIGKNQNILVAACDTFRAAAIDQLKEWTLKQKVDFFQGKIEQDPASVAYNAAIKAKEETYDYLIIDTAGRLSNNTNLLNQMIKIRNVVNKSIDTNLIKTILVLDGTNGSNMIKQVEIFSKSLDVNGLIITKLDGTAKGGALVSIAKNYEIPIHYVGFGEKAEDLYEFDAKIFAQSILGITK